MIDRDGFRANVGIIISNDEGQLLWARRVNRSGWQFPQGGIQQDESAEEAMFRELREEVGLEPREVEVLGRTQRWLRYRLPRHYVRRHSRPVCIGQKQRWFMLRLVGKESRVRFDRGETPEFDHWKWVDYWTPLEEVVFFKRKVYRKALEELSPLLFPEGAPEQPSGNDERRHGNG
ncbi:MAG: RNA pyrophosphohydrolase [Gammaproteobacteria bacterium]|nr:RNA pyrophosphohydrolase [Gammaproteobacteria bacterium]